MKKICSFLAIFACLLSTSSLLGVDERRVLLKIQIPEPIKLTEKVIKFMKENLEDDAESQVMKVVIESLMAAWGLPGPEWMKEGSGIHFFYVDFMGEPRPICMTTPKDYQAIPPAFKIEEVVSKELDGNVFFTIGMTDTLDDTDLLRILAEKTLKPEIDGDVLVQLYSGYWSESLSSIFASIDDLEALSALFVLVHFMENTEKAILSFKFNEDWSIQMGGLLKVLPYTAERLALKSFSNSTENTYWLKDLSYRPAPIFSWALGFINLDYKKLLPYWESLADEALALSKDYGMNKETAKKVSGVLRLIGRQESKYGGVSRFIMTSGGNEYENGSLTIRKFLSKAISPEDYLRNKDKFLKNIGLMNKIVYNTPIKKPEFVSKNPLPIYKMEDRRIGETLVDPSLKTYAASAGQLLFVSDNQDLIEHVVSKSIVAVNPLLEEAMRFYIYPQAIYSYDKEDATAMVLKGKVEGATISFQMKMSKEVLLELNRLQSWE